MIHWRVVWYWSPYSLVNNLVIIASWAAWIPQSKPQPGHNQPALESHIILCRVTASCPKKLYKRATASILDKSKTCLFRTTTLFCSSPRKKEGPTTPPSSSSSKSPQFRTKYWTKRQSRTFAHCPAPESSWSIWQWRWWWRTTLPKRA